MHVYCCEQSDLVRWYRVLSPTVDLKVETVGELGARVSVDCLPLLSEVKSTIGKPE